MVFLKILIYSFHIRSFLFLTSTSVTSLSYFLVDSITPLNCFTHNFSIPCVAHWLFHSEIHTDDARRIDLQGDNCATLRLMQSLMCQLFLPFILLSILNTIFPTAADARSKILRRGIGGQNEWLHVKAPSTRWTPRWLNVLKARLSVWQYVQVWLFKLKVLIKAYNINGIYNTSQLIVCGNQSYSLYNNNFVPLVIGFVCIGLKNTAFED